MGYSFDLIVLGTGTAAGNIAGRCRKAGWPVAVIDKRPFGGTCILYGCDPKKILRRGPEIADAARRLAGQGIEPARPRIDWPSLVRSDCLGADVTLSDEFMELEHLPPRIVCLSAVGISPLSSHIWRHEPERRFPC